VLSLWVCTSAVADDTFAIAVIPDTQNYVDYTRQIEEGYPFDAHKIFLGQMEYIAENLESEGGDIAFVTALGDMWQHQTLQMDPAHEARGFKAVANPHLTSVLMPTPKTRTVEMPIVAEGYRTIAGKVPFSVVPGNHDYDAIWTDSKHPPAAEFKDYSSWGMLHVGGLANFRSIFSDRSEFFRGKSWYVASHDGGADSAQIFTAAGYRFLHIGLQYDPPNVTLAWAASLIKQFPGLPTIVTTHNYLNPDGARLSTPAADSHAVDPEDNNPEMVWEKLISRHDQIFMVLCGHQYAQARRADLNRHGHIVYQLLSDFQNRRQTAKAAGRDKPGEGIGDGWLRLMTFEMGAAVPVVRVRTYSSHYKKFSTELSEYPAWYKADEKPQLTDAEFHAQDDFRLELTDFRARFGGPADLH
jgi:hypothetical protein